MVGTLLGGLGITCIRNSTVEITQEYAVLITHFSFQPAKLLNKIQASEPRSVERAEFTSTLHALKECMGEHIAKSEKEIVEAFRKNKAARLVLEMG
ncbi:hypothetical protein LCGC14_0702130 [marine sediment metagenome]|uniref:Uncharacterized protein n=1 Tax=marine sediment metagenome TaxID=412755 RepID=A0A0F9T3C5_9ZZZZ